MVAQDQVQLRNQMFMDVHVCLSSGCFGNCLHATQSKIQPRFFPYLKVLSFTLGADGSFPTSAAAHVMDL